MIAAFVLFVSVQTIRQHRALETRAFDLGFRSPLQYGPRPVLRVPAAAREAPRPALLIHSADARSRLRRGAETGDASVVQAVLLGVAAWPPSSLIAGWRR